MAWGIRINSQGSNRLVIDENNPVLAVHSRGQSTGRLVQGPTYNFGYIHSIPINARQMLFLAFGTWNTWGYVYSRTGSAAQVYAERETISYVIADYTQHCPITHPNNQGLLIKDASGARMYDSRVASAFFTRAISATVGAPNVGWANDGNFICQTCMDLTAGGVARVYGFYRATATRITLGVLGDQDLSDPFHGYPSWREPPSGFVPTHTALLATL